MIEMLLIAMIVAKVGLDSAGKFVVDVGFGVRGKASPRLTEARKRRAPGAASRYFSELWDDAWTDASKKRAARRANPPPSSRPRGAARVFLSNLWRDGWVAAERRRSSKATRPRPGQQTVPGTVVPNAQDGDGDRPEDGDRDGTGTVPQDEPTSVPDEDGTAVPEQDQDEDEQDDSGPDSGPDQAITPPAIPTTEGPTMTTTMPTDTEVTSLNKAINYSESTARVAAEMVNSIDFTESSLAAGGVTGIAVEAFASAKEKFGGIAADMERAAAEFKAQLAIQEAYNANPGAGSREFIMSGR